MSARSTRRAGAARGCGAQTDLLDAAAAQVYGGDGLALLLAQAPQQVVQRQPRECALVRTWGATDEFLSALIGVRVYGSDF